MAYNLLKPVVLYTAQSMAASFTSPPVEIRLQDNLGFQLKWSGSPVGSFSVQISSTYSEDINGNVMDLGAWVSLPLSPAIAATGAPDDAYIDLNQMSAMYVRIVYTRTSGTGSFSCVAVGKAI